jgi:hypothetical protein
VIGMWDSTRGGFLIAHGATQQAEHFRLRSLLQLPPARTRYP